MGDRVMKSGTIGAGQMPRNRARGPWGARAWASTALVALLPVAAMAQTEGCVLIDGVMPEGCTYSAAGTVVRMPAGANTTPTEPTGDLGPYGFSITVEAVDSGATTRRTIAGAPQAQEGARRVDRLLADAGVQVTYDGLAVRPRLAVSTLDMKTSYTAGAPVTFNSSTNYPAWITRAEIRVTEAGNPARVVAVIPIQPNGQAAWPMPAEGEAEMAYSLRVYDAAGRYDETRRLAIARSAADHGAVAMTGPIVDPAEGDDMTARRAIPVRGGAITVTGTTAARGQVQVMGEVAKADPSGAFVIQRILPPGVHDVRVGVAEGGLTRKVEVPQKEWFYVGLADLTYGRENGGISYTLGRVAGYAKGHTANGFTITASLDTREGELKNIFRDLDQKNPDRVLNRILADDVYPTFGDDSTSFEDAPTSGKVYLKVEKDKTALLWGDYKADKGASRLVRSDRTLYGLQVTHESLAQTAHGEARLKFSAYAAEPDRLMQRDVLRGTGGSAYFLKRQDVLNGTETILVQWRDPVSGNVVQSQELVAGQDYDIDYFQGVVLLKRPLSSVAGGGFLSDRPNGEYDVDLVAQYEYVPTTGNVDGYAIGARAEVWATDSLRFGVSGAEETTGIADNRIVGADVLFRRSDETYLSLDFARSEGPGFGTAFSLNGGLDLDPATADPSAAASAGVTGAPADAFRVEAKANLAEITNGAVEGNVAAYYDKKEAGFVSADYDVATTQTAWGLSGKVDLTARSALRLSYEDFEDAAGKQRRDAELGLSFAVTDQWMVEAGVVSTDRQDPAGAATDVGERTDLGLRVTWTRDEDLKAWAFGQATVSRSGGLPDNDRIGFGVAARLNDRLTAEAEVSDGSLGAAGRALLRWDNGAGTAYRLGYQLDPHRSLGSTVTGRDKGVWVLGADSQITDSLSYRAENTWDLFGDRRSLASTYGVRYTPSDVLSYDASMEFGETEDGTGGRLERRAVAAGVKFADGDRLKWGLRGEYRRETSATGIDDRTSWLVSGFARYQTSEDWRLLANLDALVSDSDQANFRDGRYIEGNIGFAYRPVAHDRVNALFRYTYLEDLPGTDQVNIDGDVNGPRQRSHILSFDVNYDLNPEWTLGFKYGYRMGEVADRGTNTFSKNTADLAILRLDYHVVHNWDLLLEGRIARYHEAEVTETGALAGVYRHFGNNVKFGVGYQFGDVSDDLRLIEGRKEGAFINLVGKF